MRGLESIVPPPELCDEIPEGCFADSALIGIYSDGEWIVLPRSKELEAITHVPAPTLAEIMEALPKSIEDDRHHREFILIRNSLGRHGDWQIGYATIFHRGLEASRFVAADPDRPECATLELWLQLHEAGMIPQKDEEK